MNMQQKQVDLIATYEELGQISPENCTTEYFGDYGMHVMKASATDEQIQSAYQKALQNIGISEQEFLQNAEYEYRTNIQKLFAQQQTTTPCLEVFVTNLSKYVEGVLVGEWLSLPTDRETLMGVFNRIGLGTGDEYFITEYNSSLQSISNCLGEHENINELNYLAGKIQELSQNGDLEKFSAALELGEETGSAKELINLAEHMDTYSLYPDITTEAEYGQYLVKECHALPILDNHPEIEMYFDFEAFGRDTVINESGTFTEAGYIVGGDSLSEVYHSPEDIPTEYIITDGVMPEIPEVAATEAMPMLP